MTKPIHDDVLTFPISEQKTADLYGRGSVMYFIATRSEPIYASVYRPRAPFLRELDERRKERDAIAAASEPPPKLDRSALGCADALMAVFGMTRVE